MPSSLNHDFQKATAVDPEQRLRDLIDAAEPRLSALFTVLIENVRDEFTLEELIFLLEQGRIEQAIETATRAALRFSTETQAVFTAAGINTAEFLTGALDKLVVFDGTNEAALRVFQQNQLRFIQGFTADMREATRLAITEGLTLGLNPLEQARNFRNSIGLTTRQVEAINNYRRLLQQGSLEALQRELRDKRFDNTVRRASTTGVPLTKTQVDRMVERYSAKQLRWRSENIARTEALRAVHEGSQETYRQAIANGDLSLDQLEQTWHIARTGNVRDSHSFMSGQVQDFGDPFRSGLGNLLRFPGDPSAPAADVINCQCAISTRITKIVI